MAEAIKAKRNWWKYAFFVLLIAFEITREILVVSASDGAKFGGASRFFHTEGFATASGMWKRIDGGGKLVPALTTIECDRTLQRCTEISVNVIDGHVMTPLADHFEATFNDDGIAYENDRPDCAKYSVRLDYRMRAVFAVRERIENPSNERCQILEERIEMRLDDATQDQSNIMDGHFLPIFQLIDYVL